MEEMVASWCGKMERYLKALHQADDQDAVRETLDTLQKHVSAWDTLYRPPPSVPMTEGVLPMVGRRGWSERTIAST